jgi:zinc protease
MAAILQYQLAADFTAQRNQIVRDITLDELNQLAKRHLDPASFSVVVVGPAKQLRPELLKLETLGLKLQNYQF